MSRRRGWVSRFARSQTKKAWRSYKRGVKRRSAARKKVKAFEQKEAAKLAKTTKTPVSFEQPETKGGFLDRHWRIMDARSRLAQAGHTWFDRRELRAGVLTAEELQEVLQLPSDDSVEEWREKALERRRQHYRDQRSRARDQRDHAPLTMVYGGGQIGHVKQLGFRPPPPRDPLKKTTSPDWKVNPQVKPVRTRRRHHLKVVANSWRPQFEERGRAAMAANGALQGAAREIEAFAEQFPETRTQLHDHLGAMGAFGDAFSHAIATFERTLAAGKSEDNPGLPPEVLKNLQGAQEAGELIKQSMASTIAAWEDYFAEAIRVAQDEHTPSKAALTS